MKRQYIVPAINVKYIQIEYNLLAGSPVYKKRGYVIGPVKNEVAEPLNSSFLQEGSILGTNIKPVTDDGVNDETNGSY